MSLFDTVVVVVLFFRTNKRPCNSALPPFTHHSYCLYCQWPRKWPAC